MKLRLISPPVIVDLGRVGELSGIVESGGSIVIGATTTHHDVEVSPLIRAKAPLLAEVASCLGDVQVRNRGTIGGSVAHADPAADWPAGLLALEAECLVRGPGGSRTIPAAAFFVDAMTSALEPGEILTSIRVPIPAPGGQAYEKVRQAASGFALVGIAVQLEVERNICRFVRIGVTGLAPRAFRATAAEAQLSGRALEDAAIRAAADLVATGQEALDDMHASSEFRGHLARVHTRRAIRRAADMT
jgi:carbon-monoxide dehydrogenase medium subunit